MLEPKELDAYDWGVVDERIRMVYSVPGYYDVVGASNGKGKGLLMLNEVVNGMDGNVSQIISEISNSVSKKITIEYQVSHAAYLSTSNALPCRVLLWVQLLGIG